MSVVEHGDVFGVQVTVAAQSGHRQPSTVLPVEAVSQQTRPAMGVGDQLRPGIGDTQTSPSADPEAGCLVLHRAGELRRRDPEYGVCAPAIATGLATPESVSTSPRSSCSVGATVTRASDGDGR